MSELEINEIEVKDYPLADGGTHVRCPNASLMLLKHPAICMSW